VTKERDDRAYDRDLLLRGAKRNAVLDLSEVQRYGVDSYGDSGRMSGFPLNFGVGPVSSFS
jgi:hypothetical protein